MASSTISFCSGEVRSELSELSQMRMLSRSPGWMTWFAGRKACPDWTGRPR